MLMYIDTRVDYVQIICDRSKLFYQIYLLQEYYNSKFIQIMIR